VSIIYTFLKSMDTFKKDNNNMDKKQKI